MAGNDGMPNVTWVSSAEDSVLRSLSNVDNDNQPQDMNFSLSYQLDMEVNKLNEMVKYLESLERALEQKQLNKQTTVDIDKIFEDVLTDKDDSLMEKPGRSGIPIPRRRQQATPPRVLSPARKKAQTSDSNPRPQEENLPDYSPVGSPPKTYGIWPISFEEDKGGEKDETNEKETGDSSDKSLKEFELAEEQVEDQESYAESVSIKSAAKMFGGQAVIRRIPTPSSQRRQIPLSSQTNMVKPQPKLAIDNEDIDELVTSVDDILDQPLKDLSRMNDIDQMEQYDNVNNEERVPTYEQFIHGEVDTDDEMEDIKIPKPLSTQVKQLAKEYAAMDYTVLGTISPLNDTGEEKGDNSKEEMSFVLGRPASPVAADSRIKRCLSPPYEAQASVATSTDVSPLKRMAAGFRNRHNLPPLPPSARDSKLREISNNIGIMCEGCNNCLLDLKRQALRLMYPDNTQAGDTTVKALESVENIKEKLQVSASGYRFSSAGNCEVCDAHVTQLKNEAVSMVQSIQQAQSESVPTTNLPSLIGSINVTPTARKINTASGPHIRYRGTNRSVPGSFLSKSAPIAIQAQAYLEQNVRPRGSPKRQMLMRGSLQDKPPSSSYPRTGEMYPQGVPEGHGGHGQFSRQPHYSMSGPNFINTPYMQHSSSMQAYHQQQQHQMQQQQYQAQQQQQFQQYHPQQQQQQQYGLQQHQQYSQQQQQPQFIPHQQQGQHPQYSPQHHQYTQQQQYSQQQPYSQQQQYMLHQHQMQQQQQQTQQPYQHFNNFLHHSHSAPGSPARIQSPPPRLGRVTSPPPGYPSRVSSPMSPPPTSASPAASFFARAAQKLSKKKKRHHQPEPEPPPFPTKFSLVLRTSPPSCPPCLLRNFGRQQTPGVGKVRVMLRVVSNNKNGDHAGSFLNLDTRNKQVTVYDPAASGYATSAAHRKAAMAPKMFAFDGVFSPDDCLTEVCSGSLTDIIQGVVAGADGCLFSYGYSKLGKSYTMIGGDASSQTLGIIPCAISWLFKIIGEQRDQTGARFSVRVSAVEVSGKQEVLKDLLADVAQGTESGVGTAPGVYLREDPISGTQLENQSELRAPTAEKAAFYLDAALNSRSKNEDEGRSSHLLFTLHVYQYRIEKENKAGLPGVAGGRSRLHLIDLGSASKSKDPNNVALSLSALGNVIMALLNGQRHVPHRDSKVAQLLRDSLGNITCRTCMIAHVSQEIPHYNESLQVIQLAARIHRMKRRKLRGQFSGTSSDDSSTDGSSIHSRPYRGFRMGTLHEGSSLSDPDYTSSSEQSCDTVIYLGKNGQSLSDRELTDHEGPPRSVPRTNPRLPRRASGSRSSGDEGSNSDSGHSLYRSHDSLSRLSHHISSPVRDVSVTSSRQTTPVRDMRSLSRGTTPVRDFDSGSLSSSPNSVTFNLPRKHSSRTKSKQDSPNNSCYASVNIVEKLQKGVRVKRSNSSTENKESEQWIDGPAAAIYPEKKQNTGEQWIDGPPSFVLQQEAKQAKNKMSSEEMWIDGPREMLPENQTDENQNRTPKMVMHTTSKKVNARPLSSSPKHSAASPSTSPASQKGGDKIAAKPGRPLHGIKERPDSTVSFESSASNTAQPGDSRPNSMITNPGDSEDVAKMECGDTRVKPFVRDWVEKHGLTEKDENLTDNDEKIMGIPESTSATFRRSKPLDCRTKKLLPSSSTPKASPGHSPKHSPATQRRARSSTPKLTRPQFPTPGNPTKRVTDWLRNVENNQAEESIYMEGIVGKQVIDSAMSQMQEQELSAMVANFNSTQDISSCSTMYPDTTLNDSRTPECTEEDIMTSRTGDTTAECEIANMSFDSSVDTAHSAQNRESLYELEMDEKLEKTLPDGTKKCDNDMPDDETFSTTSCSKDSDMDMSVDPFVECMETLGNMKKSETMQSVKTLLAEATQDTYVNQDVEPSENVYSEIMEDLPLKDYEVVSHILSRKPDGASNPNLIGESFHEKTNISALREEYLIANAISSQSPELSKKGFQCKTGLFGRPSEGDGQMEDVKKDKYEISSSKPPLPTKPCTKCGYSQLNSKPIAKMCKECQKMVALSIKNSHSNSVGRRDKDKSKHTVYTSSSSSTVATVTASAASPTGASASKSSKSKSQSPSHSRLPIFSKNLQMSSKDLKLSRKKEKECKKAYSRSLSRGQDSDSGNDSGIVAMEKTLLSPYATVTKPRTVSHSSSGHGSDNSSNISTDLISKQGGSSDKQHGGTSSGYESMLRDSEGSESSTAHEDSASELSSGDKKKGSKKKRLPSTRRSRSAPARQSESPESSSRKSSPSSKNSSLSPTSKAWMDKHKTREEPMEIKDYDADDVKRMTRHRAEEESKTKHDKGSKSEREIPNTKEHYIVDRSNWSFDLGNDGNDDPSLVSSFGYHRV